MDKESNFKDSTKEFEKALEGFSGEGRYVLRLFVSGMTPRSMNAIRNVKDICREHLQGRVELEVIDIYQHPDAVKDEQVFAIPTLIKKVPPPLRKFIGDLSDKEKILKGLELVPK
jgi:circadian clock protein KaiB